MIAEKAKWGKAYQEKPYLQVTVQPYANAELASC
jgi:hypothetical protein